MALLLLPLPQVEMFRRSPALFAALENLGHPLAFALVGFSLLRKVRTPYWMPALSVLGITLTLGVISESLQRVTGRDPSMSDVAGDLLGALWAILFRVARSSGPQRRRSQLVAAWALVVVTGTCITPLLATVGSYIARRLESPLIWRPESFWLQRFARWQSGMYPGLAIIEPSPDWHGYQWLVVELHCLQSDPVVVHIRVHDGGHNDEFDDRFNRQFLAIPGRRLTMTIPLGEIANAPAHRTMDMHDIEGLTIFIRQSGADFRQILAIDEIRLLAAKPEYPLAQ